MLLELKHVSQSYAARRVLRDLSFALNTGDIGCLLGPSGCGKTTVLRAIAGFEPITGGEIVLNGELVSAPGFIVPTEKRRIGMVFQDYALFPHLNVAANVGFGLHGQSRIERNKRVEELLQTVGLEGSGQAYPHELSGGQQQRVAVARALVNDPEILLADEPVGNLDSISAEHVMDSFEEINMTDRKTVILVTHDAKYLPYAHRVIYMRDGVVRRIVVNPEKVQIKRTKPGETIVTEIEQLARLYPYAEPIELKVKSLVNFATQAIGFSAT